MKKGRSYKALAVVSVVGMCFSLAGVSGAAWQVAGGTDNFLTMDTCRSQIVEEYEEPDHVDPSGEVTKIVNVANTGNVDTLVRVSLKKQFGTEREDGSFLEDKTLDPGMIILDLNTTYWREKDGYFYYKEVLKAGETTKEPLMSAYRLSEEAGNAYKAKDARILVEMESVQAQGNAVSVWHTTCRELGISVPEAPASRETCVTYLGQGEGFDIEKSKIDLFANFKNLLPGCGRSQKIILKNASDEGAEIFLRAEAAEQEHMSGEQQKLVNLLLRKYAVIELSVGDRVLYSGPVDGNPGAPDSTMGKDISLGVYPAGQSGTISVQLSLSPEMDNRFQALTGKVKWVFTVEGDDTGGAIYPAKTGIISWMGWWCAMFLLCSMTAALSFLGMRRQKQRRISGV